MLFSMFRAHLPIVKDALSTNVHRILLHFVLYFIAFGLVFGSILACI